MYHRKLFQPMSFLLFFLLALAAPCLSTSAKLEYLNRGASLSIERSSDIFISPDQTFSAGFWKVGDNSYCFAIWFTLANSTPVWIANRDQPVNGMRSTLKLQKDGNLVLKDAGRSTIWETGTSSASPAQLSLMNTGNLVLMTSINITLWQSFDHPTDTLLPLQLFARDMKLVSSRSQSNYSTGFYSFFYDNDNVLRLLYDGPNISSIYWPDPGFVSWDNGRSTYNSSRTAVLSLSGQFRSSDNLSFTASDFGVGPKRRLTMDHDGNLRLYSLEEETETWQISWFAIYNLCAMHGQCGPNGICVHEQSERRCSCPSGFEVKEPTDLSRGCQPTFNLSCDPHDSKFLTIPYTEFYGYDLNYTKGISLQQCMNICLESCSCKAFLYKEAWEQCYPKTQLLNGYTSPSSPGIMHIKVPRNVSISDGVHVKLEKTMLKCDSAKSHLELDRKYEKKQENSSLRYLLWFVAIIGGVELLCIVVGWWYMHMKEGPRKIEKGYVIAATGFKQFSYAELKKATQNFREIIGRGGGGVVYKAKLQDGRVAAVKRLEGVNQDEAEFLAEVSIIGRINHMNLILVWGFCAEKKHRLLVYEYMERGSLAENLSSNALDWDKRFDIAVGTAKGLAYLHEECLEWVLHCDIKPQNILLDGDYFPKVADFGLSKLRDRRFLEDSSFSRIRGTRGYLAPEWILNQPITSKVDVYSYGIVVLEMVTGKRSYGFNVEDEDDGREYVNMVTWVREMMSPTNGRVGRIEDIMDPKIVAPYAVVKMELLVRVALRCVEENRDARPTMSQVVEMLHSNEIFG